MSKIKNKILEEVEMYSDIDLPLNPVYAKTQEAVIDLIDRYWMSKYRDEDTDDVFINQVDVPTLIAMKQIDLDTKDIRIHAVDGNYWQAWFFEKQLGAYLREKNFGVLLNKIIYNLPKYGHVILKRVNNELTVANLQTLITNPVAPTLNDTPIIEMHLHTEDQLVRMAKDMGWANVDKIIDRADVDDFGRYTVYERFSPIDEGKNYHIISDNGQVLFEGKKSKNPYRGIKWEDVYGRLLGRGQVERLFENQIAKNELERMLRSALQWSSKHIFQTRDETIARNLLSQVDNGEILRVLSEVTPVANEERNLSAFDYADQKWNENTRDRSFSQDTVRGERPPAGTPLGTTRLQFANAQAFFDMKKEDLGLFLREILLEDIIPEFKNQNSEKDLFTMMSTEKDFDVLQRVKKNGKINEKILDRLKGGKGLPSGDELKLIKALEGERIGAKRMLSQKLPKGVYDNLKIKIDVLITSEQVDSASKLITLQTALNILGQNPQITQDPTTSRLFFEMLNLAGVNPEPIMPPDAGVVDAVAEVGRGGSLPRPTPVETPTSLPNIQQV